MNQKDIHGFLGYRISQDGRAFCCRRHDGTLSETWREMVPARSDKGYLSVMLYRDGKGYRRRLHRLVLEAFVGPCPSGMETRHLNGIPGDNSLSNLAWGTSYQNFQDTLRHGAGLCRLKAAGTGD